MPVVNAGRLRPHAVAAARELRLATPLTPPLTCPTSTSQGVDMNRNYPFGWGSNIGVTLRPARLRPGL